VRPLRTRRTVCVLALVLALATIPVHEAIGAERVIVALGDSLTAGLGVAPDEAWPALLEAQLHRAGSEYRVVNAGVSGDTSAGGLARLDWVIGSVHTSFRMGEKAMTDRIVAAIQRPAVKTALARLMAAM